MKIMIPLEHHPNDSRLKIIKDGIIQTLNTRMGTGGGNVPLIWELEIGKDDEILKRLSEEYQLEY